MKPENVLVSTPIGLPSSEVPIVKISDFGLAREVNCRSPYTLYVSTRWYRAPEILLKANEYGLEVDIWAFGTIAYEICTLRPMFPGKCELNQIAKICSTIGSPDNKGSIGGAWTDAVLLSGRLGIMLPEEEPGCAIFQLICRDIGESCQEDRAELVALADWIKICLQWNPQHRPSTGELKMHRYFVDYVHGSRQYESDRSFCTTSSYGVETRLPESPTPIITDSFCAPGKGLEVIDETASLAINVESASDRKLSRWVRKLLISRGDQICKNRIHFNGLESSLFSNPCLSHCGCNLPPVAGFGKRWHSFKSPFKSKKPPRDCESN